MFVGIFSFVACSLFPRHPDLENIPEPIGGYSAIEKNTIYPKEASEAGIEGIVEVYTYVDTFGNVTSTVVLKGFPGTGLNEAAIEAIKQTSWKPAIKGDQPVGMWVKIPVVFTLGRITQPVPIGGYEKIVKDIMSTNSIIETGIQDSMAIMIYVEKTGIVTDVTILKGVLTAGVNSSVIAIIRQTHFESGKFRGNPQGTWLTIYLNFGSDRLIIAPVKESKD